jgi:glycosyltransferase involved in cell wall biosynthesis
LVLKKIFWVSWHHNPYNDFLFDELSKHFDLDVFYLKKVLSTHPWRDSEGVKHKSYYLNNVFSIFSVFRKCLCNYDIRVIAGWNHPIMIALIFILAIKGREYSIWSDTPALNRKNNFVKKTLRKWWLDFAFKYAKKILVTGNIGVQSMIELGVKNVLNFPFATNLDYFVPLEDPCKYSVQINFLSSGRLLNSHKGFDIAIKSFGFLKRKNPSFKFSYLIAGTGPDELLLKQLIISEDLEKEIKLVGWIQQNELLSFYQSGDVLIHPSHFDPYPNVVLEAMACGLPVIGSNSAGSVSDRVVNGKNGFVFLENDVVELSKCIELLANDPELIPSMRLYSREIALKWHVSFNIAQLKNLINVEND